MIKLTNIENPNTELPYRKQALKTSQKYIFIIPQRWDGKMPKMTKITRLGMPDSLWQTF